MKEIIKVMLQEAQDYCEENDKSTEFMLEYMQQYAGVELTCVLNFLEKHSKRKFE